MKSYYTQCMKQFSPNVFICPNRGLHIFKEPNFTLNSKKNATKQKPPIGWRENEMKLITTSLKEIVKKLKKRKKRKGRKSKRTKKGKKKRRPRKDSKLFLSLKPRKRRRSNINMLAV